MIITKEWLESGASMRGGWSKAQMKVLGYDSWVKGWKRHSIGKEISELSASQFIALRDLKNSRIKNGSGLRSERDLRLSIPYKEQYLTPEWQQCRLKILERDGFKCMACGSKTKQLHVHHNTYDRSKMIWQVPDNYLITFCDDCHKMHHN